jgi:glycosyltransferase involved in cell wall biosynthesis
MSSISIIIPTLAEENYIRETLESLKLMKMPHEVIVSDGGSTDKTVAIAREYTDKIVVWNQKRRQTFGEAKNAGATLATGDFLVFIDADVIIPNPDAFFERLIADFKKMPKLQAVTVSLRPRPEYEKPGDAFFVEPLNFWYVVSNNIFHFGNASGEFQMIRRVVFEKVKGYREDLPGGEDTDMFNRISKVGRTHSHWQLSVLHTCRRAHKTGWLRLYGMWMVQGFHVLIFKRAGIDEWKVIR